MENKLKFRLREEAIKRKRNKFFAPAIRNIGKTKDEILKEKSVKLKEKRVIKVGGGFQIPDEKTLIKNANMNNTKKFKLVRSASFNGKVSSKRADIKENKMTPGHPKETTEVVFSFMSDDYWEDLNQIK